MFLKKILLESYFIYLATSQPTQGVENLVGALMRLWIYRIFQKGNLCLFFKFYF